MSVSTKEPLSKYIKKHHIIRPVFTLFFRKFYIFLILSFLITTNLLLADSFYGKFTIIFYFLIAIISIISISAIYILSHNYFTDTPQKISDFKKIFASFHRVFIIFIIVNIGPLLLLFILGLFPYFFYNLLETLRVPAIFTLILYLLFFIISISIPAIIYSKLVFALPLCLSENNNIRDSIIKSYRMAKWQEYTIFSYSGYLLFCNIFIAICIILSFAAISTIIDIPYFIYQLYQAPIWLLNICLYPILYSKLFLTLKEYQAGDNQEKILSVFD